MPSKLIIAQAVEESHDSDSHFQRRFEDRCRKLYEEGYEPYAAIMIDPEIMKILHLFRLRE